METKIDLLYEKKDKIAAGGGEKRIAKQHDAGKLTARERLNYLLDEGSFVELDAFVESRYGAGNAGDGVVTGYGMIEGRLVYVYAQDFTVVGGSLGEMHAKKICKVLDLALKMGAPVIGLNDSGGARIPEAVDALSGYGNIFYRNTIASGVVPQISAIMGPCAGGAVYSPALTDFIFMSDKTSYMFITGPQVIKTVTREEVTSDALGGAMVHNQKSGVAHFVYPDEYQTLDGIRRLISFLPSSNRESAPIRYAGDDVNRVCENLNEIMPESSNKAYEMKTVIKSVIDDGDFFEVQPYYAKNMITGFGRIGGRSVGILANEPTVMAGSLDINASDKAARFISICDSFNIPLLTFVDVPGFLPGTGQEYNAVILHGAQLLYAYGEATVPKITITLRKSYGGSHIVMGCKQLRADLNFAWPTAEIAVMGASGAVAVLSAKEAKAKKEAGEDVKAFLAQKEEEYTELFANPYQAASYGYIDDVIEPRNTRFRICRGLAQLAHKRQSLPAKKHGCMPM